MRLFTEIDVVEVQKPMVFCDFYPARATLCGDRRGRGAKTHGFLRFLTCSRDPLRGLAWSRCKNPWFFAISNLLARPFIGIGVVEVQKPMVFCDFCGARVTFCGNRRGRDTKTHGFLRFLRCSRNLLRESAWSRCKNSRFFVTFVVRIGPRELSRGSCTCSRNRRVAGFDSSLVYGRASRDVTCILQHRAEQFAQSKLHRATCAD